MWLFNLRKIIRPVKASKVKKAAKISGLGEGLELMLTLDKEIAVGLAEKPKS